MKPDEIARFRKICGMLASDHAGEVVAAAVKATAMLKAAGWTWADVSPPNPYYADAKPGRGPNFWDFYPGTGAKSGYTQPTAKPKNRPDPVDADVHWRDQPASNSGAANAHMRNVLTAVLQEMLDSPQKYDFVGTSKLKIERLVAKGAWSSFDFKVATEVLMQAGLV